MYAVSEKTFDCWCCMSFYLVLLGYVLAADVAGGMGD